MLKSMKQKFGARRSSSADKNDAPIAASNPPRQASNPASSSSRPAANPTSRANRLPAGTSPLSLSLDEVNWQQFLRTPLPAFKDVQTAEKQTLFVKKLHLCAFTFDFTDQGRHVREKEIKRQTLVELVDYVNTGTGKFTEAVSEDIIFMLSANLFRALHRRRLTIRITSIQTRGACFRAGMATPAGKAISPLAPIEEVVVTNFSHAC